MIQYPAMLQKDMYKAFHVFAYREGTEYVYSNFTNRFGHLSNVKDNTHVVFVGLQAFIKSYLIDDFNKTFFDAPQEEAIGVYREFVESGLFKQINTVHIKALHSLGFLPLEIKALQEGSRVPYGVPPFVVFNTVPGFGWLTNMIETVLSSETAGVSTSATTAYAYRKRLEESNAPKEMIKWMGHDFSYRGMLGGTHHAAMSGFGHLCSFYGSDTIPAAYFATKFYNADLKNEIVFGSVDATEHSTATSYITTVANELEANGAFEGQTIKEIWGEETTEYMLVAEYLYMKWLLTKVTPTGILSYVTDSFDFWGVVTKILPKLKDLILERDGKLVIRPDSGDPVKIIVGDANATTEHERDGLITTLGKIFGTTKTDKGLALNQHIGAIYGDSITLERQDQIISGLEAKGLIPEVVYGIGSFTYQYVTRDTHGSAVKATAVGLKDKGFIAICKDPKTDKKKKSAKGFLRVDQVNGEYVLTDNVPYELEGGELKTVFRNGVLMQETSLAEIRSRIDETFK